MIFIFRRPKLENPGNFMGRGLTKAFTRMRSISDPSADYIKLGCISNREYRYFRNTGS